MTPPTEFKPGDRVHIVIPSATIPEVWGTIKTIDPTTGDIRIHKATGGKTFSVPLKDAAINIYNITERGGTFELAHDSHEHRQAQHNYYLEMCAKYGERHTYDYLTDDEKEIMRHLKKAARREYTEAIKL